MQNEKMRKINNKKQRQHIKNAHTESGGKKPIKKKKEEHTKCWNGIKATWLHFHGWCNIIRFK